MSGCMIGWHVLVRPISQPTPCKYHVACHLLTITCFSTSFSSSPSTHRTACIVSSPCRLLRLPRPSPLLPRPYPRRHPRHRPSLRPPVGRPRQGHRRVGRERPRRVVHLRRGRGGPVPPPTRPGPDLSGASGGRRRLRVLRASAIGDHIQCPQLLRRVRQRRGHDERGRHTHVFVSNPQAGGEAAATDAGRGGGGRSQPAQHPSCGSATGEEINGYCTVVVGGCRN